MWEHGSFSHSKEIRGRYEAEAAIDLWLEINQGMAHVVAERFTITANTLTKAREYDALYIIGVTEYLCKQRDIPFALESPGNAKRFCSDDRLKKAGMWKSSPGGHANDASRHLFLELAKRGLIDPCEVDNRVG